VRKTCCVPLEEGTVASFTSLSWYRPPDGDQSDATELMWSGTSRTSMKAGLPAGYSTLLTTSHKSSTINSYFCQRAISLRT
jgi:hypothetical protein